MQMDPAGYVDGMSLYTAFAANPASAVDPLGTEHFKVTASDSWVSAGDHLYIEYWEIKYSLYMKYVDGDIFIGDPNMIATKLTGIEVVISNVGGDPKVKKYGKDDDHWSGPTEMQITAKKVSKCTVSVHVWGKLQANDNKGHWKPVDVDLSAKAKVEKGPVHGEAEVSASGGWSPPEKVKGNGGTASYDGMYEVTYDEVTQKWAYKTISETFEPDKPRPKDKAGWNKPALTKDLVADD
jgi:hypothetical protein